MAIGEVEDVGLFLRFGEVMSKGAPVEVFVTGKETGSCCLCVECVWKVIHLVWGGI